MNLAWVVLGAAFGAPLRYLIDRAVSARQQTVLPLGTLVANLIASLLLGFVVELVATRGAPTALQLGLGTGLAATLSTYSTFSYEIVHLMAIGRRGPAALYATASVVLGIGAAFAGVGIAVAI
jgi:CrcB protein